METELTIEEFLWLNRIIAHLRQTRGRWGLAGGCIRVEARPMFGHCPITSYAGITTWDAACVERATEFLGMPLNASSAIVAAADNAFGAHTPDVDNLRALRHAMLWAIQKEPEST